MDKRLKVILDSYNKRVEGLRLLKHDIELFKNAHDQRLREHIIIYNRLTMIVNIEINVLNLAERIGFELSEAISPYYSMLDSVGNDIGVLYEPTEDDQEIQDRLDSVFTRPFSLHIK